MGMHGTNITPRSATAATSWSRSDGRVYFQDTENNIREARYMGGQWSGGDAGSILCVNAKPGTPLAAINWNNGQEIRVYYLSNQNILQECSYSHWRGWSSGSVNQFDFKAFADTKLAAICWPEEKKSDKAITTHIRVYLQEPGSNAIRSINGHAIESEGLWNFGWSKGSTLPVAVAGTSIAAIQWFEDGDLYIRVYYQDPSRTLKCQAWNVSQWAPSTFNKTRSAIFNGLPRRTAIAAITWGGEGSGDNQIRVFYQNGANEISEGIWLNDATEWHFSSLSQIRVDPGIALSVAQFGQGRELALYYPGRDSETDSSLEYYLPPGDTNYRQITSSSIFPGLCTTSLVRATI